MSFAAHDSVTAAPTRLDLDPPTGIRALQSIVEPIRTRWTRANRIGKKREPLGRGSHDERASESLANQADRLDGARHDVELGALFSELDLPSDDPGRARRRGEARSPHRVEGARSRQTSEQ